MPRRSRRFSPAPRLTLRSVGREIGQSEVPFVVDPAEVDPARAPCADPEDSRIPGNAVIDLGTQAGPVVFEGRLEQGFLGGAGEPELARPHPELDLGLLGPAGRDRLVVRLERNRLVTGREQPGDKQDPTDG